MILGLRWTSITLNGLFVSCYLVAQWCLRIGHKMFIRYRAVDISGLHLNRLGSRIHYPIRRSRYVLSRMYVGRLGSIMLGNGSGRLEMVNRA